MHRPTMVAASSQAVMVPHPWRRGIQQSAEMLRNGSPMLLKLEKNNTYYYLVDYYLHDMSTMTVRLQVTIPAATYGPSPAVPTQ